MLDAQGPSISEDAERKSGLTANAVTRAKPKPKAYMPARAQRLWRVTNSGENALAGFDR